MILLSKDELVEQIIELALSRQYIRDAGGQFSRTAGTALKPIAKAGIQGAVGGAVTGAIGGAFKGALNRDESLRGNRFATRVKKGMIRGAIRGAKRGALRAIVTESFKVAATHSGSHGWAVKAAGGLTVAVASRKMKAKFEPDILQKVGQDMFRSGFGELALESPSPDEKQQAADVAYYLADFLENSKADMMATDIAALQAFGFVEQNGMFFMHREDVEELLAGLLAYGESEDILPADGLPLESFFLANPYHDDLGRFTEAPMNKLKAVVAKTKRFAEEHKQELLAAAIIAGVAIAAGGVTKYGYDARKNLHTEHLNVDGKDFVWFSTSRKTVANETDARKVLSAANTIKEKLGVYPDFNRVTFTDTRSHLIADTESKRWLVGHSPEDVIAQVKNKPFSMDDVKFGAKAALVKIGAVSGGSLAYTWVDPEYSQIVYKDKRQHVLTHELIHRLPGHSAVNDGSKLKQYEGMVDALAEVLTPMGPGRLNSFEGYPWRKNYIREATHLIGVYKKPIHKILWDGLKDPYYRLEEADDYELTDAQVLTGVIDYGRPFYDANEDRFWQAMNTAFGKK